MRNIIVIVSVLVVVGLGIGFSAQYFNKDAGNNEGKPLVKVGPKKITMGDLEQGFNFDQSKITPENMAQVQSALLNQLVNQTLLDLEAKKKVRLSNKDYKQELEKAKTQIKRNIYVENIVEENVTEDKLKEAYIAYVDSAPKDAEEIRARHILLKDKSAAENVIKQLKDGKDFVKLATEKSEGPTAKNGGDLGYFTEGQMVKEFSDAAFAMKVGSYSKTPVKTQFGWHVIKVEDKRKRPVATYQQALPILQNQLSQQALNDELERLKEKYPIKILAERSEDESDQSADNDETIDPAAGGETTNNAK